MTTLLAVCAAGLLGSPADLTPLLAVEDYAVRAAAVRRLTIHLVADPEPAVTALRDGLAHPDPEVRRWCDHLLRRDRPARLARTALVIDDAFKSFPFLDALWYDPGRRTYDHTCPAYWAHRHWLHGGPAHDHPAFSWANPPTGAAFVTYQAATRALAITWVTDGVPLDAVRVRFLLMHYRDAVYYDRTRVGGPLSYAVYAIDQVFPGK